MKLLDALAAYRELGVRGPLIADRGRRTSQPHLKATTLLSPFPSTMLKTWRPTAAMILLFSPSPYFQLFYKTEAMAVRSRPPPVGIAATRLGMGQFRDHAATEKLAGWPIESRCMP